MCFVNLKKAFVRVLRKVMEWALRKKGLAEVLVQAVISIYESLRMKVKVGSGTSEEFWVGLVCIKGMCYNHKYLLLWLML